MGADGELARQLFLPLSGGGVREPPPDVERADAAANALALNQPDVSAIRTLTRAQGSVIAGVALVLVICALLAPQSVSALAGAAAFLTFAVALGFRCAVYLRGTIATREQLRCEDEQETGEGVSWPVYTLLIALKDEAESAAQLSAAIFRLDYPRDRLDIKLLIETGDEATREALRLQRWPPGTQLLIVPPGMPKTKPRALNYGLRWARGEFVVVYDAEDRPRADQLKAAVKAFRAGGNDLACVQAPLVGDGDRGWIAGQWALEYAVQFGRLLPGLASLGLPIALGGTSNHFRRAHLEAAGGWDAWNVTEDADLGVRLARRRLRVGVIAPPTLEAPPETLGVWLAQRSRWLKGFLQTWLVVMRQPGKAVREMGLGNFLAFQLTLGVAILSAIVHGPWAIWLVAVALSPDAVVAPIFLWFVWLSYAAGLVMALAAPGEKSGRRFLLALTLPIYWPLQSAAMARALYSLARRPHYWAKTPHGAAPSRVAPYALTPDRRVSSSDA